MLALCLVQVEASIFWEKLLSFFNAPSLAKWNEVVAWQVAGLFLPLITGPMKIVAYLFWNVDQDVGADYMKAYLYFYDIKTLENFWGYFADYIVYGTIYSFIPGASTDFYEIPLTTLPDDLLCYNLNGYDPDSNPSSVPTYGSNSASDAAGVTCTSAVDPGARRR